MAPTRVSLISSIETPLGFFSLVALIVEAMLGGLALKLGNATLAYLSVALLALLIIVVLVLSMRRPDVLIGKSTSAADEVFATGLGEEIYTALDGYYSDLTPDAREEAYTFLEELLKSSPHAHGAEQKKFCVKLAETVIRKANLIQRGRGE